MNDKKVRKRRIIKDGIVDIDDIKIEPGFKYSNWIPIVRNKMSEREHILLKKRIEITNKIIIKALQEFYQKNKQNQILNKNIHNIFNNKFINGQETNNIILSSKELIIKQLNAWKGVQRSKKTAKLFRDYFKISKNWWDQKKIEIISIHFWMPIIKLVNDITKEIGTRFFAQNQNDDINTDKNENNANKFQEIFCEYLNTLIFKEICQGMLKMANSRERLLIPAGVYVILYNKQDELPPIVKKLLCDNDQIKACVENGKGGKHTRDIIVKNMEQKCDQYELNYTQELKSEINIYSNTVSNISNIQMKDEHEIKNENGHNPDLSLSPPTIDQHANIKSIMSKQEEDEPSINESPQPSHSQSIPENIIPTYTSHNPLQTDFPMINDGRYSPDTTNLAECDQNYGSDYGDHNQMMMDPQPMYQSPINIFPPTQHYPHHRDYGNHCNQTQHPPQNWSTFHYPHHHHPHHHHPSMQGDMSLNINNGECKLDVDANHDSSILSSIPTIDSYRFDDTAFNYPNPMFHINHSPEPQQQVQVDTRSRIDTRPRIDTDYIPPPQYVVPPPFNNSYPVFNNDHSWSYSNHHSSSFNASLSRYSPY